MKKIFSFLMALCATLTLSVQAATHAPKAALTDTIKVSCASWQYTSTSSTNYHHVLLDNAAAPTYEFEIDCIAVGTEAMMGTFIVPDPDDMMSPDDYIDESDSKVVVYNDGMGDETYLEYGTKVVITQNDKGYDLNAIIVSEGTVYAVTAHMEPKPTAKDTVALNYTTEAEFWSTKSLFGFTVRISSPRCPATALRRISSSKAIPKRWLANTKVQISPMATISPTRVPRPVA